MNNISQDKHKKIVIVGSLNTDMVVKSKLLPRPGETILGGTFLMNPGGKGANQAVASARLGADVTIIGKTGNDIFGLQARNGLIIEDIDVSHIFEDNENMSGVALIFVDESAENCISVASGANANLNCNDIKKSEKVIAEADLMLMQLEVPLETVEYAASKAKENNVKVILNPAPASKEIFYTDFMKNIDIIVPNETETEILTGINVLSNKDALLAAQSIAKMGVNEVIITMGKNGAFYYNSGTDTSFHSPSVKVDAVDTTAAGDCFCGALAVALVEGKSMKQAIEFANKAAALSVTKEGAQASLPSRLELELSKI